MFLTGFTDRRIDAALFNGFARLLCAARVPESTESSDAVFETNNFTTGANDRSANDHRQWADSARHRRKDHGDGMICQRLFGCHGPSRNWPSAEGFLFSN
jgi:hypothetical protein